MSTQSVRDRIALFNSTSSANGSREDLTAAAQASNDHGVARDGAANGPGGQQDDRSANPWASVATITSLSLSSRVSAGAAATSGAAVAGTDADGVSSSEIGGTARQAPPPRPARRNPPSAVAPAATTSSSPMSSGATPAGWVAFGSGPIAASTPSPSSSTETTSVVNNPVVPARPPVAAFASFNHGTTIPHPTTTTTTSATTIATSQTPPPRPSTFVPPPGARPLVPIPTSVAAPSPVSSLNHPLASAASTSNTPPPLPPRVGPSASTNASTFSASSDTYANSAATSRSVSPVSLASNGGAGTPRRGQPPPPPTRGGIANGSLPRNSPSPAPAATAATTNQLVGLVKNVAISTSQASLSGRSSPTNAAKVGGLSSNTTADSIFPTIPPQTRSRYLSLFRTLANTATSSPFQSGTSSPVDASATAPAQAIVDVWRRSRLPLATLADVWDAVVPEPRAVELNGMQFASGMWIIDQVLGGKSVQQVVSLY